MDLQKMGMTSDLLIENDRSTTNDGNDAFKWANTSKKVRDRLNTSKYFKLQNASSHQNTSSETAN